MDKDKRQRLRSELGLGRAQWHTAVRLGFFYDDISELSSLNKEEVEEHLIMIARELHSMVFRPLCCELLDKERRCLWLWDRYVSLAKSPQLDVSLELANNSVACNAEIQASSKFRRHPR